MESLALDRTQGSSRFPTQAMFLLCDTESFPTPPLRGTGLFWGAAVSGGYILCVCARVCVYVSVNKTGDIQ